MTDLEIDANNAKQLKKAKELIDAKLDQIDPDSGNSSETERLRMERDDAVAKLELAAEAAFNKAKKEAGAPDSINTPEALEGWKLAKGEETHQNPDLNPELGSGGSGKAPLSGEPSGQISHVKEYDSVADMMEDLRQRTHSEIPEVRAEAEEIQKKLLEKMAKERKSHNFEFELDLHKLMNEKVEKRKKSGNINWDVE